MRDEKYLETADTIGARLCRDAIWSGNRCNWLGDSMDFVESRWQVTHRIFGPELYHGTAGMGLFLANLFASTQDSIFKKTAEGALNCAIVNSGQFDPSTAFGFYSGVTGIAYALMEAGELLGAEQFIKKGHDLLEDIDRHGVNTSQSWDIISGSAGVIPVQLKLYQRYQKEFLLAAAQRHGDLLLQSANRGPDGWSWKTIADPVTKDLTGFSHGTAGIAWSLLELYNKLKEDRFLHAAKEALRYERKCYDPQQENWPDFRSVTDNGTPVFAAAWCHGAPGIGLSRIRATQLLDDTQCRIEAEAAVRTTSRSLAATAASGQGNYSLCHGNSGNAELLLYAAEALGDENSRKTVAQVADDACQKYRIGCNPWPCGVLNGGETPNLMLGLAGIGYFYLRLYDPKKTPSILLVCPE